MFDGRARCSGIVSQLVSMEVMGSKQPLCIKAREAEIKKHIYDFYKKLLRERTGRGFLLLQTHGIISS